MLCSGGGVLIGVFERELETGTGVSSFDKKRLCFSGCKISVSVIPYYIILNTLKKLCYALNSIRNSSRRTLLEAG